MSRLTFEDLTPDDMPPTYRDDSGDIADAHRESLADLSTEGKSMSTYEDDNATDAAHYHVGAQNDALYIVVGDPPSQSNDYPRHDAARKAIAHVYDANDAARIAAALNTHAALVRELQVARVYVLRAVKAGDTGAATNLALMDEALRDAGVEL